MSASCEDEAEIRRLIEGWAVWRDAYRHLAYLQEGIGYAVKADMPGVDGPEVRRLYADGAAWLAGKPPAR